MQILWPCRMKRGVRLNDHERCAQFSDSWGDNAMAQTLYARLGGYDAIAAVCDDLLPRMMADPKLGRFWKNRGKDGMRREKQLLVDFLCASAGGTPLLRRPRHEAQSRGAWA
jgi:truncated hemoglobin YjbI